MLIKSWPKRTDKSQTSQDILLIWQNKRNALKAGEAELLDLNLLNLNNKFKIHVITNIHMYNCAALDRGHSLQSIEMYNNSLIFWTTMTIHVNRYIFKYS